MHVAGGGGGSWPFLCASMSCWSFAIPPHLEPSHPIPLGTDPQEPTNLQSRLGGGFVPSCTCLPVPSLLLITSGRGTAILTLQPLPPLPQWLWSLAAPSLQQRGRC